MLSVAWAFGPPMDMKIPPPVLPTCQS